jgi:hypothetical protein
MTRYKYSSWMAAFILGLGIMSYKPVKEAIMEKPVDKEFTLAIYKKLDYSSDAYNYTYGQVHITVEKLNGSKRIVELDTTFDNQLLKNYPTIENAQLQKVRIPNVFVNKEEVLVSYEITYYSEGSLLQMQNSKVLKNENEHLNIGI